MSCFQNWKPVFALFGVNFSLAVANLLFKKALSRGTSFLLLITYRQTISSILLIPVSCFLERKSMTHLKVRMVCYLFLSAFLGVTLTQYSFLVGLKFTSPTFACAFINISPVMTFIFALPLRLEKVRVRSLSGKAKILGTLICISGALVLIFYKGMAVINSSREVGAMAMEGNGINAYNNNNNSHEKKRWAIGSLFLFGGSIMWSSWFLLQSRIGKKYPFQYSSTAIMCFFSAVQSAFLGFIMERDSSKWILRGRFELLTILYAGVVGSALSYVVMAWCVKQKGPVFTSAFSPFIQIFAAIFDVSLLHSPIHLGSIIGSILVIAGMYFLLWGKSRDTEIVMTNCSELSKAVVADEEIAISNSNLPVKLPLSDNPIRT